MKIPADYRRTRQNSIKDRCHNFDKVDARLGVARQSRKCDRACYVMARRTVFGIEHCSVLSKILNSLPNIFGSMPYLWRAVAGVTSVLRYVFLRCEHHLANSWSGELLRKLLENVTESELVLNTILWSVKYEVYGMTNIAFGYRTGMAVITWWIGYGWLWWSNPEK